MNPFLEIKRENDDRLSFSPSEGDWLPHFHSHLELHYAINEGSTLIINGEKRTLKVGEFAFSDVYAIHSTSGTPTLCLIIPPKYINDYLEYKKEKQITQYFFKDFHGTIKEILNKFNESDLNELKIKGLVNLLLSEIYKINQETAKVGDINDESENPLIRDIIVWLNTNYAKKITLDDICAEFGYCRSHISKTLNHYLGCNLNNYLCKIRLNKVAEKMKANKQNKIITVAYDCGFDSLQTFYRCFKKVYNCSPYQYFNQYK